MLGLIRLTSERADAATLLTRKCQDAVSTTYIYPFHIAFPAHSHCGCEAKLSII